MTGHSNQHINIELAYALPHTQYVLKHQVQPGTTAKEAIMSSEFTQRFPTMDMQAATMGVFGQVFGRGGLDKVEDYVVEEGDRIEIYRPLIKNAKSK